MRHMFYRFISKDQIRSFVLEKVVFLDNYKLEEAFQRVYEKFYERSCRTIKTTDQPGDEEDAARQSWRKWTKARFNGYLERVSGNDVINLVMGARHMDCHVSKN